MTNVALFKSALLFAVDIVNTIFNGVFYYGAVLFHAVINCLFSIGGMNMNFFSLFSVVYNDAPEPWQLGFQDSASPGFTGLVTLHNTIGFYLIVISVAVFWIVFSIIYFFSWKKYVIPHKYLTHGTVLELV
jgi:Cytochrome C oxidase subunit II, transmembrane domain